jgi:CubicO group peptidase (beta-lactamase class C family)
MSTAAMSKGTAINDSGLHRGRLARLEDTLSGYVARGEVPGLVSVVSRRGEAHVTALGTLGAHRGPVRRDTIFRISSMTKPITAVAALILVEECKLRLDDPVDRLLPELADRRVLTRLDGPLEETVPAMRPITLRDLLTFRMGFGLLMARRDTHPILEAAQQLRIGMGPPGPAHLPAPDEWMRRLGQLPLMAQPGAKWLYNTSSDVLGVLIARAADQPFDTFLRERLFEPLGMKDTGFSVPASARERFATAYANNFETGALEVFDPAVDGQWNEPPAFPSGGGGLVSTVDDYLAFAHMLLAKGRHGRVRILSRPSVEAMTCDHLTPENKAGGSLVPGYFDSHGWGFGVSVVTRRDDIASTPGKYGWDGGLGTSFYADPREEMITLLFTQRAWTSPRPPPICLDFWTSAYQAIDD